MKDQRKTKKQLIDELAELKQQVSECENLETEHKREEAMLRESEARYRSVFDHSLDANLLTAPNGQILAANPQACAMLGYTEAELQQLGRAKVVDPADSRLPLALEECRRTGKFRGELTLVRKDRSVKPVGFEEFAKVIKDLKLYWLVVNSLPMKSTS